MDPLRIAVRTILVYLFLLLLLRLAGKRGVKQVTPFDFVFVLIVGDMIDDALWAEVPFAQFVVATSTLVLMKLAATSYKKLGVVRRA
ncbi:MAG TPA: hypothetical protein VJ826_09915 [Candidatus Polarisedimenticolaceae bacterium]|nr:hypothetical protein [Candidatus Polarisedimenticolaceae bacterium]